MPLKWIEEIEEGLLLADGFDGALLGYARRVGRPPVAIYDREICIEILGRDMPREEAEDYFEFNVAWAWVGEETPVFLIRPPKDA